MTIINYFAIPCNSNIIIEDFKKENYLSGKGWTTHKIANKKDILSDQMIDFLSKLNFPIFINLFHGTPNTMSEIHIDNHPAGWAINYAWDCDESMMYWYSSKNKYSPKLAFTTAKTPYWTYNLNQVEVVDQHKVESLCLVRTNIPHAVHNYSKTNSRWCLSIRTTSEDVTFEDMLEKLSQFNLGNSTVT